jgi:hypothetical protein
VLLPCLQASIVHAEPRFFVGTAEQVTTTGHGKPTRNKIYSSGTRMRSEADFGGKKLVSILDLVEKRAWMVYPPPAQCVQQSYKDSRKRPSVWSTEPAAEEFVASETIEGHTCKKYKRTLAVGGRTYVSYLWRATDLNGSPIKATSEDGSYQVLLTNIDPKKPDPKLFEPPQNCKEGNLFDRTVQGAPDSSRK